LQKIRTYILFVLVISIFASCYTPRYVYSPVAHNVPLLSKKGDSKLALNFSTNVGGKHVTNNIVSRNKGTGADIQGAYAISKRFALQGAYANRIERNSGDFDTNGLDSSVIRYKRNLAELGIGWYSPSEQSQGSSMQVFAGMGLGNFSFIDDGRDVSYNYYSRYHKVRVIKFYLQPAFILRVRRNFYSSISSRLSVIHFSNIRTNYTDQELAKYSLADLNRSRLFWEPATVNTISFTKLPGLQLEFQAGMSFLLSGKILSTNLPSSTIP